jgi:hypothetical protein
LFILRRDFNIPYHYAGQVKANEVGRVCGTHGSEVYKVLVGKHEGKRPLGRPRRRWENVIIMDLEETGLGGVDWN